MTNGNIDYTIDINLLFGLLIEIQRFWIIMTRVIIVKILLVYFESLFRLIILNIA